MKKPTNLKTLGVFVLLISVCLPVASFAKSKDKHHEQEKHDDHRKDKHHNNKPYKLPVAAFTATQKTFTSLTWLGKTSPDYVI